MNLEVLRDMQPYQVAQNEKEALLVQGLNELSRHHYQSCPEYRNIINGYWGGQSTFKSQRLVDIPYLPVSLFKQTILSSVSASETLMTLTSSGTSGQSVSQIIVDRETSRQQQLCLAHSMTHVLGKQRLPMLVADTEAVVKNPKELSARGAGVLGMMRYGHRPLFLVSESGESNNEEVKAFLQKNGSRPFFIFGFTFMVWTELMERFGDQGLDLSNGILVHSGGWKKMEEKAVDAGVFRDQLKAKFGLIHSYNFYGMVEQMGSVFLEGEDGLLFPPNFTDVLIRDPETWEPCEPGNPGLIQVLSLIPRSYPGHSLLTEDLGVVESSSENGRLRGKGLRILGRVKRTELRGCSDVIATASQTASS